MSYTHSLVCHETKTRISIGQLNGGSNPISPQETEAEFQSELVDAETRIRTPDIINIDYDAG